MGRAIALYVEDELYDIQFMRRAFKLAGLETCLETVTDGQQAIDYLSSKRPYTNGHQSPLPAVIILDLNLPLVSGFDVLKWVRQQPHFEQLPVVIFSSSVRTDDRTKACKLGATDYLEKPSSPLQFTELVERVKEWL